MKSKVIIILATALLILMGCGDDDKGTGPPATAETIVGVWLMNTFSVKGNVKTVWPAFAIDTTVIIDTAGAFPPDGMTLDIRVDNSYTLTTSEAVDNMFDDMGGGAPKLSAKNEQGVEEGTWTLTGGVLTTISDDTMYPDTTVQSVTISGTTGTFVISETFNETEEGMTMTGSVTATTVGTKAAR